MKIVRFVMWKLLLLVTVIVGVTTLMFTLTRLSGDAAVLMSPPEASDAQGTVANDAKRVPRVTLSLLATQGCRVRLYESGREGTRLPLPVLDQDNFDAPPPTFTGSRDVRLLGYSRTGQVEVYGDEPFDATVRAIIPEVAT